MQEENLAPIFKLKIIINLITNMTLCYEKCPSELFDEIYISKRGRHIAERVKDHNGRDYKSHILKHSLDTGHEHVTSYDFSIISKNFNGNKRKQKIAKSLLIKQLHPTVNIHNKSASFKLFN